MRVEQLMSRPVQTCAPEDSLARAAGLMWQFDCGCLPVVVADGSLHLTGVITDRDICMNAMFHDQPLSQLLVSQAMTRDVRVCRPDDTLGDAEKIMRDARIRRLPVLDGDGSLVGMLALADLAQEANRELPPDRHEIFDWEIGDTLAAISRPPHKAVAV